MNPQAPQEQEVSQNQLPQQPQPEVQIVPQVLVQPAGAEQNPTTQKTAKSKTPVAALVLYILGYLGLILGLINSLRLYTIGTLSLNSSKLYGMNFDNLQLLAVVSAVITIATFTLINFIRNGKRWALVTYTVVSLLSLINVVLSKSAGIVVAASLITIGLLGILWTKNRDYFV